MAPSTIRFSSRRNKSRVPFSRINGQTVRFVLLRNKYSRFRLRGHATCHEAERTSRRVDLKTSNRPLSKENRARSPRSRYPCSLWPIKGRCALSYMYTGNHVFVTHHPITLSLSLLFQTSFTTKRINLEKNWEFSFLFFTFFYDIGKSDPGMGFLFLNLNIWQQFLEIIKYSILFMRNLDGRMISILFLREKIY